MIAIGYTYDADTHCPDCAELRFGEGVPEGVADSEGNEPGAIFTNTESDTPGSCGTCGADIDTALTDDGRAYVREHAGDFRGRFPELFAGHDFQSARFTGAVTCSRCGLLPLDADDFQTDCA